MPTETIPFAFALHEKVIVIAIDRPARVDAQTNEQRGLMYRVIYWSEGSRKTEWVFGDELRTLEGSPRPGTALT